MGNVIPPQYGVPLTADELNSSIPTSILYGVTPSNEFIPVQINSVGALSISGTISVGTVTIEGLDPVDSTTHPLAIVNFGPDGYALRTAIFDGGNQLIVNPDGSINTSVNNFPATQNVNVTNASIPVTQSGSWTVSLATESIEIGTVDQGTPNTLANAWPVEITDGSNILGTLTNPIRIDPTGTTTQPISGSISVSNFPATQPISGTVTVDQGTSPWVVSGSVTTSPDVNVHDGSGNSISSTGSSLNVDVTNFPATVAVTQSTSPWVISGTVTANAGTNLNTSALALDTSVNGILLSQGSTTLGEKGPLIQGAVTTSKPSYTDGQTSPLSLTIDGALRTLDIDNSLTTIGTLGSLGASVSVTGVNYSAITVLVTGIWSGGIVVEKSVDGISWVQIPMYDVAQGFIYQTLVSNNTVVATAGTDFIRVRMATYVSGSASITIESSNYSPIVEVVQPSGASLQTVSKIQDSSGNAISNGQQTMANSVPVVIASNQTAVPVSLASTTITGTVAVTQSTSPWVISGAVTANIGTTGGLALDSSLTTINTSLGTIDTDIKASQPRKLQDGAGNAITSTITRSTVRGIGTSTIDGPQLDSYGRFRISSAEIPFALFFSNTNHPLYFNAALTGSGTTTFNSTLGSARLTTTTSATDSVIIQTKRFLRYIPGISFMVALSGTMGPQTTNVRKRWGYFSTNDGFFFEQTATDVAVTLRTSTSGSPVDTRVPQSSWNIDKLDGTGPSGVILDSSKQNLYIADFVWQGSGRLRFGIINGGTITYCHEFLNSNTLTGAWMKTPSRPGRVELTNTGVTAGTNNMDIVCVTAVKESTGDIIPPYTFGATRGRSSITVGATPLPLISIRPNTTFNGLTNRVPIVPSQVNIYNNQVALIVQVVLNPILTGASFTSANSFSAAQIDISATAVSGGVVISETYIAPTTDETLDLSALAELCILGLDIAGVTSDILSVVVTSTAGNTTVFGGITWQEFQ